MISQSWELAENAKIPCCRGRVSLNHSLPPMSGTERIGRRARTNWEVSHRPLGYEPSTLSLIWRYLPPILDQKWPCSWTQIWTQTSS
jgi:hypothetical protein